jgi:GT2 family glycosyltransferase
VTETEIIIPIHNRLEDTRECLTWLSRNTDAPYRLLLIDNRSDAPTAEWLAEVAQGQTYGPTRLLRNEVNLGWNGATNQGLAAAAAEFVCLLNNDTLPGPGWLGRMRAHFERHPELALMNPRGDESSENRRVADRIEDGFCLLMPRRVWLELGPFDETYTNGNWSDNDYARRVQARGWVCGEARDAFVYHLGHRTFDEMDQAWRTQSAQNEAAFYARWGRPQRIFLVPSRRLDAVSDRARDEVRAVFDLARQGHRVWVPLLRRERIEAVLGHLEGPDHANVTFLRTRLPWPLSLAWAAWKWRYLKGKGRVEVRKRAGLIGPDATMV